MKTFVLVALTAGCAHVAFTPLSPACGALEGKEPPALVAQQIGKGWPGSMVVLLYRDGLVVAAELPGPSNAPQRGARTHRRCLGATETSTLLARRDAGPSEAPHALLRNDTTFCLVAKQQPANVDAPLVCERPALAAALHDAYEHNVSASQSCEPGTGPCRVVFEDVDHGSAHAYDLESFGVTLEADGQFRCEQRVISEHQPTRYVSDEGTIGRARMKALFALVLEGVLDHASSSDLDVDGTGTRSVRITRSEPDASNPRYGPYGELGKEDSRLVRERFAKIASALGPSCVPPAVKPVP